MKVLSVRESGPAIVNFLHCGKVHQVRGSSVAEVPKVLSKNYGDFDTKAEIREDVELVIIEQRNGLREPSSTVL